MIMYILVFFNFNIVRMLNNLTSIFDVFFLILFQISSLDLDKH